MQTHCHKFRACSAAILSFVISVISPAQSAEFHAIATNFSGAPRAVAYLNVSFETSALANGPIDVRFQAFATNGTFLGEFAVPTNADGFASSAAAAPPYRNLFRLSGGEPVLVRAITPGNITGAYATLQQHGPGTRMIISVPPDRHSNGAPLHVGRQFSMHVGDIRDAVTASILVANLSGSDVVVDVFTGRHGAAGNGKYTMPLLPNRNTWQFDLLSDDHNANLILTSTGEVIVQLVINDGSVNALTILPASL